MSRDNMYLRFVCQAEGFDDRQLIGEMSLGNYGAGILEKGCLEVC